jgi:DNA-binding CsgD family transcriptional regulator
MLYGRGTERAAIGELLASARAGRSGVLVIRGEPGIGKTALLDQVAHATDATVLRGRGIEPETDLPYAGLHLFLRPLIERIGELPEPQEVALRSAFGQGAIDPDGRFLVGLAVLSLLTEAAGSGPLLCLIDDAQWLDDVSAETLLFVARRLHAEPVVMVFAVHADEPFPAADLPTLPLAGLDRPDAAALLTHLRPELTGLERDRLLAVSAGNPLALLELRPQGTEAPLPERIMDGFLRQVERLPEESRRLLLIAAAEGSGDLGAVLKAAAPSGLSIGDLEQAEWTGLVQVSAVELSFRHALLQAAIYQAAPLSTRLAAHAALAEVLDPAEDGDRRAWHLAKATTGADEAVAAELEGTALRARERNGYEGAAVAYELAAELSPARDDQIRRLVLAGEAAAETGRLNQARAVAERAAGLATDPILRARAARVRATADFKQGRPRSAHALLTEGARHVAGMDTLQELRMQLTAVNAAWSADDLELLEITAERLAGIRPAAGDPMAPVHTFLVWMAAFALGRTAAELPPVAQVMTEARDAAVRCPHDLSLIVIGGIVSARERQTRDVTAAMAAESRVQGRIGWLTAMLSLYATTEILLGDHETARTSATEALTLARDTGQLRWIRYSAGTLAYLAAVEGDEERCLDLATEALGGQATAFTPAGRTWAHWALAVLDLGLGRAEAALGRLDLTTKGPSRTTSPATRGIPDIVEALVRSGRAAEAAAPLAHLQAWADQVRQPSVDALVARCRALLAAETAAAEESYLAALALHKADSRPFEQARTLLLYGEWLRRRRRKADARPGLAAALGIFEALGARPWAARAATELGATDPRRTPEDAITQGLTPQERQITKLAATGLSNKEIAAQLFLSPRTVGYHLNKAFPKLGVASRTELAALALT